MCAANISRLHEAVLMALNERFCWAIRRTTVQDGVGREVHRGCFAIEV